MAKRGRKKLPEDVLKVPITFKLHPSTIQLIRDTAKARQVKVIRIVEECLSVLNNQSI